MSVRAAAITALALSIIAPSAPAAAQQAAVADTAAGAFDPIEAVDEDTLSAIAGREDLNQITQNNQRNTVANNSVTGNSVTGAVQIDGQAFQNLSGLALINANSGNNVAINSAMNVNISLGSPN